MCLSAFGCEGLAASCTNEIPSRASAVWKKQKIFLKDQKNNLCKRRSTSKFDLSLSVQIVIWSESQIGNTSWQKPLEHNWPLRQAPPIWPLLSNPTLTTPTMWEGSLARRSTSCCRLRHANYMCQIVCCSFSSLYFYFKYLFPVKHIRLKMQFMPPPLLWIVSKTPRLADQGHGQMCEVCFFTE